MSTAAIPYLTLTPTVEDEVSHQLAIGGKSPYATADAAVLRREENPHDEGTVMRPAFARDIEKVLNLPAYNRYTDKTQVFSFVQNADISRRALHVQLVSRVARNIGRLLGLNCDLIEAIALGHDLGHTPFGHAGERFLSDCFHKRTGGYFNHNVQSVRVLDQLYRRNISLQTLDGVLCHNGEFAQQKLNLGTIDSFQKLDTTVERCIRDQSTIKTLCPSTLEGCVVRVSDMIAYLGKDRQDAVAMGVLDGFDCFQSSYIGADNGRIINNMTADIVNNSFGHNYIAMSEEAFEDIKRAKRQNYEEIYLKEGMVDEAENIVEEMFEEMYDRLLTDLQTGNEASPLFTHHVARLCELSRTITAEEYLAGEPNQIVVDYLSSMTDNYFMALYEFFFPRADKAVLPRDYCWDLVR